MRMEKLNFEKITYNSDKGRKLYRKVQDDFFDTLSMKKKVSYDFLEVEDMQCLWAKPKEKCSEDYIILYCHGGGYNAGGLGYMKLLAGKLADACKCPVFSHEYSLSPENRFPAAIDDTYKVWRYLVSQGFSPDRIIVAGDSAGGNLALELCFRIRKHNEKMPGRLVLLSPWTDMTMKGNSYIKYDGKDPVLSRRYITASREMYAPGEDFRRKSLSPIYGDLHGFPDTLIQVGEIELLKSDSERLYKKMKSCDVNVKLQVYKRVWHVFQQMPLKKTKTAMDNINKFVKGK